jgi:ATP-dependent Lon protease
VLRVTDDKKYREWVRLIQEDRAECTPSDVRDSAPLSTAPPLLPTDLLLHKGWPQAAAWAWSRLAKIEGLERDDLAADYWSGDKPRCKAACRLLAERLFSLGEDEAALCAQMLSVDAGVPTSFDRVLPQLAYCAEHLWPATEAERKVIKAKLSTWWSAADGNFEGDDRSIFLIAHHEWVDSEMGRTARARIDNLTPRAQSASAKEPASDEPSLVVMPKSKTTKLGGALKEYEELIDARLPLVIARDLQRVRKVLLGEYPHAMSAIDLVLRDLREGQPMKWRPILLSGPAGTGKSRLIRGISEVCGLFIYRIDGSSSTDSVNFGGTSKAWSNTMPCAPARAICQSRTANVICAVEEIDKSNTSQHNGRLVHAILPFLERETARCYRDASLDAELDLSWVNHIATSNSVEGLPAPLRDRYRIIKVPSPRLVDLPALAANVVRDIAAANGEEAFVQALENDELDVIARAWTKAGFSMRKLQAIVSATLEARDQMPVRH